MNNYIPRFRNLLAIAGAFFSSAIVVSSCLAAFAVQGNIA